MTIRWFTRRRPRRREEPLQSRKYVKHVLNYALMAMHVIELVTAKFLLISCDSSSRSLRRFTVKDLRVPSTRWMNIAIEALLRSLLMKLNDTLSNQWLGVYIRPICSGLPYSRILHIHTPDKQVLLMLLRTEGKFSRSSLMEYILAMQKFSTAYQMIIGNSLIFSS